MTAYFFDSSALVKCYIVETGTTWARTIAEDEENFVHVTSLTRVEIIAALTRRFRSGDITQAEFDLADQESRLDIANEYEVASLSDRPIDKAVALAKDYGLRAYDAVQLSAALDIARIISQVEATQLTLVSSDLELNAAATVEGLKLKTRTTTKRSLG